MSEVVWFKSDDLSEKMEMAEVLGLLGIGLDFASEQQLLKTRVLLQALESAGMSVKAFKAHLADIVGTVAIRFSTEQLMNVQMPLTHNDLMIQTEE